MLGVQDPEFNFLTNVDDYVITVRHHECQRILYGFETDFSRFPHDMLRYTTIQYYGPW